MSDFDIVNAGVVFREIEEDGIERVIPFEILKPVRIYISSGTKWSDLKIATIGHGKRCYVEKIVVNEKIQWKDETLSHSYSGKSIGDECINYLKTTDDLIYVFVKFYN